ncbi:MAG: replicative DNA helicase [bacterium]|nr:replicative DNA helicase [bacterium]
MIDKQIKTNLEAEKALLGSIFMSSDALELACEELEKEVFSHPSNATIFEVLQYLHNIKQPVSNQTVVTELVKREVYDKIGGAMYIKEVTDSVATSANINYYIKEVVEQYTRRKLIEVSTSIVSKSQDNKNDITSVIEYAENSVLAISKIRKTSSFREISEVLTKVQHDLESLTKTKGNVTGLTSGLYDLDKLTTGFHPNQLIIIAARPAVGKTALALNFAVNAAKATKKSIVIFSLEMPAEQLLSRMISSLGQINGRTLQTGNLENDDWRRVNEAISQLADTNIYFHDAGGITVSEIKAKCRRLSTKNDGLGLVIIDYLQLVDGSNKSNRQQEVSEISRGLKTMAMELNVPVIALSQLSRNVEKREDKKPVLSDLRESGSIEQDADLVAALHSAETEVKQDESPNLTQLIILKHRNGPTKTIDLLFKKNTSTFLSFKKEDEKI